MATSIPPTRAKAQSDIMVGRRFHDLEREAKGRRHLAEAKIAAAVERALENSPPLTAEQVRRLTALMRGSK